MAFSKGHKPWNRGLKGIHLSPNSEFKKGAISWNTGKAIWGICLDCRGKTSKWTKRDKAIRCNRCYIKYKFQTKENHPRWKGGITTENRRIRSKKQWQLWRESVFKRDNWTCADCGTRGVLIEPHHIIPIRENKKLVFELKNGITLCRPCHQKTIWKESNFAEKYSAIVMTQE